MGRIEFSTATSPVRAGDTLTFSTVGLFTDPVPAGVGTDRAVTGRSYR
ncbi:hypothetical protein [Nonomuraea angiospora]